MQHRHSIPLVLTIASVLVSTMGVAAAQQLPAQGAPEAPAGPREGRRPAKLQPARGDQRVDFAFEDAELPELVRFVARVTGRRFILSGTARAVRVTIVSESPVTPAEVYDGFLSVLAMHGMTVVRSGRYHRIVETEGIEGHATPVVTDRGAPVHGDAFVTRMHRIEGGSIEDAATLAAQFSSPSGSVTTHAPTHTLILTATASNIRRMIAILDELEPSGAEDPIYVTRVRHADAEDVAHTLDALMPSGRATKIVAVR